MIGRVTAQSYDLEAHSWCRRIKLIFSIYYLHTDLLKYYALQ
jgi:hypothetical protein